MAVLKATAHYGAFGDAIIEGRITGQQAEIFFAAVRKALEEELDEVKLPTYWSMDTLIILTDLYNLQAMSDGSTMKTPNCFDRKVLFDKRPIEGVG